MKKVLLLGLLLITSFAYAQFPAEFVDGLETIYLEQSTLTTTERDALTFTATQRVEIWNSTTDQKELWNGTAWVQDLSGGGGSVIAPNREMLYGNAAGDGVTSHANIQAYGSSGFIKLTDGTNVSNLYSNRLESRLVNDYSALFYNLLRHHNATDGSYYIQPATGYTDGVTLFYPAITANQTIATLENISSIATSTLNEVLTAGNSTSIIPNFNGGLNLDDTLNMSGNDITGVVNITSSGVLTIPDNGLVTTTNTSGQLLVNDGANYNPVTISGDATLASDGTLTMTGTSATTTVIANAKVDETGGILKGQVVYIISATGGTATVGLADYSDYTKADPLAVALETKANNQNIVVVTNGVLENIDTSAFTEGDIIYLGVAGALTNVHPTGMNVVQRIGNVVKSHANTGSILIELRPLSIIDDVNGFVRHQVINTSAGTSAIVNTTMINDSEHYLSLNMQGSNSTFGASEASWYNLGYGKSKYINDGNVDHVWYTDVTDAHNNAFTEKMRLSAAGDLTVVGNVTIPTSSTASHAVNNTRLNEAISASGSNPNEVLVTTESQLYDVGNANKLLCVTSDITLTANRVLPTGVTLNDCGGSIVSGGFDLTGTDYTKVGFNNDRKFLDFFEGELLGTWDVPRFYITNVGAKGEGLIVEDANITSGANIVTSATANFTSNDVGKFLAFVAADTGGQVLQTTITGFTNSTTVTVADNAVLTTSNATMVFGYDDFNAINNALNVRNSKSGHLIVPEGTFFHHAVLQSSTSSTPPAGWRLGNGTHNVSMEWNGTFQLIPHDISRSYTLTVYKTKNYQLFSPKLIGDLELHPTQDLGKTEHNHCINYGTLAINGKVFNQDISWYYGDAGLSTADLQFMNQIDGTNNTDGATDSGVAVGSINNDGTKNTGDTSKIYTTTKLPLNTFQFDNAKEFGDNAWFKLTGGSFSGWAGLSTPYYRAFYYENFGDTTPIYISEVLHIYDQVEIQDNWEYVELEIDAPTDIAEIELQLIPSLNADGLLMSGGKIYECGRDAISNVADNTIIEGIYFYNIGQVDEGPGYGINAEDRRRGCRNLVIRNNRFRDNWGGISLVGTENVNIYDNYFLPPTKLHPDAPTTFYQTAISSDDGRHVNIHNNNINYGQVTIDRQDIFQDNIWQFGILNYTANDNLIKDNKLYNVARKHIASSKDRVGYPTRFVDNEWKYNTPYGDYWFRDDNNAADITGDTYEFNYFGNFSNLVTSNPTLQEAGENDNDRFWLRSTQTVEHDGNYTGVTFSGLYPPVASRDYYSGVGQFPRVTYKDCKLDVILEFQEGTPRDLTVLDNTIINGWIEDDLTEYEGTIISTTPVHTYKNSTINIPDSFDWANSGSNIFTTDEANVSLVFDNMTFSNENTYTLSGSQQKFMDLNHLGTTTWINPTVRLEQATTIDFTNTTYYGSNLGQMTFINPDWGDNVTVVYRPTDIVIFTEIGENNSISKYDTKATPTGSDFIIIEDVADSGKIKKAAYPTGGGGGGDVTKSSDEDGFTATGTATGGDLVAALGDLGSLGNGTAVSVEDEDNNVKIKANNVQITNGTDIVTIGIANVSGIQNIEMPIGSGVLLATPTNTSGQLMVNDGTGFKPVTVSGDATITSSGVVTVNTPYTVYTALVTQSGTGIPTAVVLQNTLGATVTFTRSGSGNYTAVASSGVFTSNKTTCQLQSTLLTGNNLAVSIISRTSTTVIDFNTSNGVAYADDSLDGTLIEFRVYP